MITTVGIISKKTIHSDEEVHTDLLDILNFLIKFLYLFFQKSMKYRQCYRLGVEASVPKY